MDVVLHLIADDGELGHPEPSRRCWKPESRPSRNPSTATTTSSKGNNAKNT
jgi:hypothetical protein